MDALSGSVEGDTVAWYENDGSQSFTEHVISNSADSVYTVFAIDVDGDGDVDALSASENDDTVAWYENDCATLAPTAAPTTSPKPTTSFEPTTAAPTPRPTIFCTSVAFSAHNITTLADGIRGMSASDVDGDGDVDALSASQNDDTVAW